MTERYPFADLFTPRELRAGWVYFPLHFFLLPLCGGFLGELGIGWVNLIYYGLGILFLLLFLAPWLYRQYNVLLDRLRWCISSMAAGYLVNYALSALVVLALTALGTDLNANPGNTLILSQEGFDGRVVRALALFIAPLLEETLMRGVVFGSLRRRSRAAAYLASVLLFSACHVWQFVLASGDAGLWIYLIQYIPVSVAFCFCYERSGSIWTPVFLHMLINVMGFATLS